MVKILDGKTEAERLLVQLRRRVRRWPKPVTLATILVGARFDSALYVKLKAAAAAGVGVRTEHFRFPRDVPQAKLLALILRLNRRRDIHGILLQLPLPRRLDTDRLVSAITPRKDVDGFHPRSHLLPPTVAAVLYLLRLSRMRARAAAEGRPALIIGRDSVFSRRLQQELQRRGFRTAISAARHRIPPNAKTADVIITALGRGPRLHGHHVKRGVVIIDVGIRRSRGRTVGDVAPTAWRPASAISPVPGGVGPLTVYYLLQNTYRLASRL